MLDADPVVEARPAPALAPLSLGDVVSSRADVLSAEIDGEVVALDIASGACFGLDRVGADVWRMIAAPAAVGDVRDALTEIYDVDPDVCARDLIGLLEALRAETLIRVEPAFHAAWDAARRRPSLAG